MVFWNIAILLLIALFLLLPDPLRRLRDGVRLRGAGSCCWDWEADSDGSVASSPPPPFCSLSHSASSAFSWRLPVFPALAAYPAGVIGVCSLSLALLSRARP